MKRTSTFWHPLCQLMQLIAICLLAYASSATSAGAQTNKQTEPPKMERLDESQPGVTINPQSGAKTKITQKREQGRVTEVKVQSGNSTYYMKPNASAGNAMPGDAQSNAIRAPQWQIMEFDLGGKRNKPAEEEAEPSALPPPPLAK